LLLKLFKVVLSIAGGRQMKYTVSADIDGENKIVEYQRFADANDAYEQAIKAEAFRVALFKDVVIIKEYHADNC
jgi:hypothetical protein